MLKNLTFIAAACLFATTGCTLTIGGTDSASDTASSTDGSAGSTSASTSGGSTSGGTTDASAGSTSESPTTTAASTTASSTTTAASTTDASGSSGGMSAYGMCGWFADGGYYACADEGAMPGVSDPMGAPIDCPDPLPAEGDKCDEMGPITGQGCCMPDGANYYCDNNGQITKIDCGA